MKVSVLTLLIFLSACALPSRANLPEQYVSQYELDIDNEVSAGLLAARKGRYVEAEFAFRRALEALPQNERILLNLATALERQQLFEDARELYESLLRSNPNDVRVIAGLARLATDQGEYDEAARYYSRILELTDAPDNKLLDERVNAYRSLSAIAFRLGDEEEATCYSEQAMLVRAGNPPELARHARLLLSRGLLGPLEDLLAELDPERSPDYLLHQYVLFLFETKKEEEARTICEQVLVRGSNEIALEGDCLWIVALTKDFQVVNARGSDLDDELRVRGFELAVRDPVITQNTLFWPERLTTSIADVQSKVLAKTADPGLNVEKLTLFAFPRRLAEAYYE